MNVKKLALTNLPYVVLGLVCTNLGEAWHMAAGGAEWNHQAASGRFCGPRRGPLIKRIGTRALYLGRAASGDPAAGPAAGKFLPLLILS